MTPYVSSIVTVLDYQEGIAPTLPPKQLLPQIPTASTPSLQFVMPSTKTTSTIKNASEEKEPKKQKKQPLALLPPMKSSQAIVTVHDSPLQLQLSTAPVAPISHRKLPSQSQVRQNLQNIRESHGYLRTYQEIMKIIDSVADDDSFISSPQVDSVDAKIVHEVITDLVKGQVQHYSIDATICDGLDGLVNSILSCQKGKISERKRLHPRGDDGWSSRLATIGIRKTVMKKATLPLTSKSESISSQITTNGAQKKEQEQQSVTTSTCMAKKVAIDSKCTSDKAVWDCHLLKPGLWSSRDTGVLYRIHQ